MKEISITNELYYSFNNHDKKKLFILIPSVEYFLPLNKGLEDTKIKSLSITFRNLSLPGIQKSLFGIKIKVYVHAYEVGLTQSGR